MVANLAIFFILLPLAVLFLKEIRDNYRGE